MHTHIMWCAHALFTAYANMSRNMATAVTVEVSAWLINSTVTGTN